MATREVEMCRERVDRRVGAVREVIVVAALVRRGRACMCLEVLSCLWWENRTRLRRRRVVVGF
jgi:hypothetical protein